MIVSSNDSADSSDEHVVHFLPVVTTGSTSRREVELLRSSARSHLAKAMHRRKKGKKKADKQQSPQMDDTMAAVIDTPDTLLTRHKPVLRTGMADKVVDQHTRMLLHYCTTSFWPGFGLGSATFHIPPFALSFNSLVAQGPALYHALLWQAAVNLNFNKRSKVTDVGSIRHYHQAVNHISQDISRPVSAIGEQTMYAILSLIGPEMSGPDEDNAKTRVFQPPLADLAWIHVFGRRPLTESHADALCRIIDLKGGINTLMFPGFRADINLMDLIRSTQKLKRPHFPLSSVYLIIKTEHTRAGYFGHGSDFRNDPWDEGSLVQINALSSLGLPREIKEVMLDMRAWVKILEAYHYRTLTNPDLSLISCHRDLIQHRLLSALPDSNFFDPDKAIGWIEDLGSDSWPCIGDIVQTALLIFSLGVTFPVTYEYPHQLAVTRLRSQLEHGAHHLTTLGLHHLLVWLGMLGALAASGDLKVSPPTISELTVDLVGIVSSTVSRVNGDYTGDNLGIANSRGI
ncbi:hypothetical protein FDECE_14247 [Fusarium decemcellulare]|nr:hypothetical protein FDECE_14247 [Fusarium decemcellulare]